MPQPESKMKGGYGWLAGGGLRGGGLRYPLLGWRCGACAVTM